MKRKLTLCAAAALLALGASPAHAWDEFGHVVVARIAWENMTPQARDRAVQLLRAAPPGSGLGLGFPAGPLSPDQQMRLFVTASHWPDDIRRSGHPGNSLHRRDRHFVDTFWEQRTDFGRVMPSSLPPFGDLLKDMPGLARQLTGSNQGDAAMALAWIIHLVGDVHQPLHTSGRITPLDGEGDAGGNRFGLQGRPDNLHAYWDGVITRNHRRQQGENDRDYLQRVAGDIAARHPRSAFTTDLAVADPVAWAGEGVVLAQRAVYRRPLRRDAQPPAAYNRSALAVAETRAALAGYRLAEVLNRALGS